MSDRAAAAEAAILEALRLQGAAAWQSLAQLGAAAAGLKPQRVRVLLAALCAPPHGTGSASLRALAAVAPRSACALALSRTQLGLAQAQLLSGHDSRAEASLRQALASSLAAVSAAGIALPSHLHEQLPDQADALRQALTSQLDLALAHQRGQLPSQLVLVLGMHRSGTSALAGLLVQAGLDAPRDLMPATSRNPRGYWESLEVMELNDRMLEALGSTWSTSWHLPAQGWERQGEASRHWRRGLLHALHANYPAGGRVVLKDPRLCVLMPGLRPWLESGLIPMVAVLPVRHPQAVAASLQAAEAIERGQALLLWLAYVFQAERHSRGIERLIIDDQQLLDHPGEVLERCRLTLERAAAGAAPDLAWNDGASGFIDPELRHQTAGPAAGSGWAVAERAELWLELAERVHGVMVDPALDEPSRRAAMDQLWRRWASLAP